MGKKKGAWCGMLACVVTVPLLLGGCRTDSGGDDGETKIAVESDRDGKNQPGSQQTIENDIGDLLSQCASFAELANIEGHDRESVLEETSRIMRDLSKLDIAQIRDFVELASIPYSDFVESAELRRGRDLGEIRETLDLTAERIVMLNRFLFLVPYDEDDSEIYVHHGMIVKTLSDGHYNPMGPFVIDLAGELSLVSTQFGYQGTGPGYSPIREFDMFAKKYKRRHFERGEPS